MFVNPSSLLFLLIFVVVLNITPRAMKTKVITIFGWGYLFYLSPISFYVLFVLSHLMVYLGIRRMGISGQVHLFFWCALWVAFIYLVSLGHQVGTLNVPYEFQILIGYNLLRYWHVLKLTDFLKKFKETPETISAYLWYPPILMFGPLETYSEFLENCEGKQAFQPKFRSGFKLIFSGLVKWGLGLFLIQSIVSPDFDLGRANLFWTFAHMYFLGWFYFLNLASWFDLVRAASHLVGIPFSMPNFLGHFKAQSVASFWNRFNMSLTRWLQQHYFRRALLQFRFREYSIAVMLYFLVIGVGHSLNFGFLIWGLLHGTAVVVNLFYLYSKHRNPKLLLWDNRYFKPWMKSLITHGFVHFSWVLWLPNFQDIYLRLFDHIKRLF